MYSQRELRDKIRSIDHKGYPACKELRGSWDFGSFVLNIDHVQGDPFASPSSLSVFVPAKTAGFPAQLYAAKERRIALEDHLIRKFAEQLGIFSYKAGGSGKSGFLGTSRPGQEILERSACRISSSGAVTMRFEAGFPAAGRSILAGGLEKILLYFVPECVESALVYKNLDAAVLQKNADLADDQKYIRDFLEKEGLCAFVADGSVLPRESGVSERPLKNAVKFRSPESLRVTIDLPHRGKITGMAVRRGVTLIVGGGYHGKSTLLKALERGVYDHIAGDGRELVITDRTAVKVRAEDGRSIARTDISLFINHLPGGTDTTAFVTENASGSTSQAAGIIEAVEAGSRVLLIDEDTSATNLLVRDNLMASVISSEDEPITPLIERTDLLKKKGISLILAAGSSGAWFFPADCVIRMDNWVPYEITETAKKAAASFDSPPMVGDGASFPLFNRIPARLSAGLGDSPRTHGSAGLAGGSGNRGPGSRNAGRDRVKVRVSGQEAFSLNHEEIDLRSVDQVVDREQTAALAQCLIYASKHLMDGKRTMQEIADLLEKKMDENGPEAVLDFGTVSCGLARPRREEIFAAMNRWRALL